MFFYDFDKLDDFIKDDLITNLCQEKDNLEKIINLYNGKKDAFSNIIDNVVELSDSIEKNKLNDFHDSINLLKKSFENIVDIVNLASNLSNDIDSTIMLYDNGIDNNYNEIKANLVEYNKQKDELSNKILNFENSSISDINCIMELSFNKLNKKSKKTNNNLTQNISKVNIELEPYDYNTLIISEKDQKAYLPFFYDNIKEIYDKSNDKYKTLQDVQK